MEGWTKKKGGWTRVIDGVRENMSSEEYEGQCGPFDDVEKSMATVELTRKEIQDKAKSLGINAKQTSKDLLFQIEVAERK